MKSLQQEYLNRALTDVQAVKDGQHSTNVQKAYGSLCHQVPVWVLTNGLALTAAFVDSKATGASEQARAFKLMRTHLIGALGGGSNDANLSALVNRRAASYQLDTLAVLDAWAFYKRFAVSLLDVKAGSRDAIDDDTAPAAQEG